jgi:hypothetical protein
MADSIVAERDIVAIGDDRVLALIDGKRDEIVSLAF